MESGLYRTTETQGQETGSTPVTTIKEAQRRISDSQVTVCTCLLLWI